VSPLDKQVELAFKMYDFNRDGKVGKEDIRQLLSFSPILQQKSDEEVQQVEMPSN
jgi:Ca2+-binding EF-hand superfamily protein